MPDSHAPSSVLPLPPLLAEAREDFLALGKSDQLQLLLEFSQSLPPVPDEFQGQLDAMERVVECQSPVYILSTVHDGVVQVIAQVPAEAPTTRGFASILVQGLSAQPAETVLAVPADYPMTLGISETVSPLRVRGMSGMLARIQRQVREQLASNPE